MANRDYDRLVKLAVAESAMEAGLWQETLRREGIECLIRNRDALSTTYGSDLGLPYSHEVLVLERDVQRAREVLGLPPQDR